MIGCQNDRPLLHLSMNIPHASSKTTPTVIGQGTEQKARPSQKNLGHLVYKMCFGEVWGAYGLPATALAAQFSGSRPISVWLQMYVNGAMNVILVEMQNIGPHANAERTLDESFPNTKP